MRVVVTGGAGFVGGHVVRTLHAGGMRIRVLDDFSTGTRDNLRDLDVEVVEGSVCDPSAVSRAIEGAGAVVHLAALTQVDEAEREPERCLAVNVGGTRVVAAEAARRGIRRLVLASSAAVYGENGGMVSEDASARPIGVYGQSKLEAERAWLSVGGVSVTCLRIFNAYGRGQRFGVVPCFVSRARAGLALCVNGDGAQSRDFVHVSDICRAVELLLQKEIAGIFNCGTGNALSVLQLADEVRRLIGGTLPVFHGPAQSVDIRYSQADARRLRGCGWRPVVPLAEGLKALLVGSDLVVERPIQPL